MNSPIKLFSPGPTPLSESVLEALSAAPLHHRSIEFEKIVHESLNDLKLLFDEKHLAVFTSTGTGALEASVVNFLNSHDSALTIDGGKFGERWSEILSSYKIQHQTYKVSWGEAPETNKLKRLLSELKPTALCFQACETSTGTAFPLEQISQAVKETSPETMMIVDGVTAVGAYPLSMKKLGVDVLVTGSQKALGLPVGLSFIACSERAFKKAKASDLPKYYFNLLKEIEKQSKNTTWFSSPTQLWRALSVELKKLRGLGLEKKYLECKKVQGVVHDWVKENNLKLFSTHPSPSLTAVLLPEHINASDVQKKMTAKGFYLAIGQADFKEKLLRIGHMANISVPEMKNFLNELSICLKELGH